ncbi:hypothetical protein ZHAS_00019587 [Anopheles sinensis]|uniref:Uncharacterized protein n=1 Tax=Anopheles sinensis TaxID=74873 RepID=A0A084WMC6_ANOSI|nr:hypothetical protein ZHAS_00019587 [Anopheles sinensis]
MVIIPLITCARVRFSERWVVGPECGAYLRTILKRLNDDDDDDVSVDEIVSLPGIKFQSGSITWQFLHTFHNLPICRAERDRDTIAPVSYVQAGKTSDAWGAGTTITGTAIATPSATLASAREAASNRAFVAESLGKPSNR